jgi:hypothetical protein
VSERHLALADVNDLVALVGLRGVEDVANDEGGSEGGRLRVKYLYLTE